MVCLDNIIFKLIITILDLARRSQRRLEGGEKNEGFRDAPGAGGWRPAVCGGRGRRLAGSGRSPGSALLGTVVVGHRSGVGWRRCGLVPVPPRTP